MELCSKSQNELAWTRLTYVSGSICLKWLNVNSKLYPNTNPNLTFLWNHTIPGLQRGTDLRRETEVRTLASVPVKELVYSARLVVSRESEIRRPWLIFISSSLGGKSRPWKEKMHTHSHTYIHIHNQNATKCPCFFLSIISNLLRPAHTQGKGITSPHFKNKNTKEFVGVFVNPHKKGRKEARKGGKGREEGSSSTSDHNTDCNVKN